MLKEVEEALKVFEETSNEDNLNYLARLVGGCGFGTPEGLSVLEKIEGRINNIYEKSQGNVPPAIVGLRAVIDASKGSYKFTFKVKNPP